MGENLKCIDSNAFINSKAKYINFSKCKKLFDLGSFIFTNCRNLESLDLSKSKITSIPKGCFSSCGNLKSIKLPDGIISLGAASFHNCLKLENIDCNWSKVEEIKPECFFETGLKELDLTNFYGKIRTKAFKKSKIKTLILGDYISFISTDAFEKNPITENGRDLELPLFCSTNEK